MPPRRWTRRESLTLLAAGLAVPSLSHAGRKKATTAPEVAGVVPDGVGRGPGFVVPDLTAQDLSGATISLGSLLAKAPTLLVFYRGGWCPYCNHQLYTLAQAYPAFEKKGVQVVAVSVDQPKAAAITHAEWTLPFPALSDSALAVHEAFRVVHRVDAETQEKYQGYGIDLEAASGRTDAAIGVPSLFFVRDGRVVWAHVDPAYKVRPTPEQVLAALRAGGHLK